MSLTNEDVKKLFDKPNILAKVDDIVKQHLESGEIPSDARLVGIGMVDNNGIKIVANVRIFGNEKKNLKIASIFEHDWDGNDSLAGKVIFTSK